MYNLQKPIPDAPIESTNEIPQSIPLQPHRHAPPPPNPDADGHAPFVHSATCPNPVLSEESPNFHVISGVNRDEPTSYSISDILAQCEGAEVSDTRVCSNVYLVMILFLMKYIA